MPANNVSHIKPDSAIVKQEAGEVSSVMLTVYNSDLALVKEVREFSLKEGLNHVTLTGVPSSIDATSVHFKPLRGEVALVEQNYDYDLVSSSKLLQKYIGKEITIVHGGERKQVRLLSAREPSQTVYRGEGRSLHTLTTGDRSIVVEADGQILIDPPGNIVLPSLPGGLLLKPTLEWLLDSPKAQDTPGEISYTTEGMSWSADYILMLADDDDSADLEGWVTMGNKSGASFYNARLKLLAGDVHRAERDIEASQYLSRTIHACPAPSFREETFSEYHLYTLQRPATILDAQTKQLSLLTGLGIKVEKSYIFRCYGGVETHIAFKNSKENNLGMPLPAGRLRVFKRDSEGSPQLAGEDTIEHTPKDELIRIELGKAFDIKGTMRRTAYTDFKNGYEAAYEVVIRNHKANSIQVHVPHSIGSSTSWELIEHSHPNRRTDYSTLLFTVDVPAEGEATLTFAYKAWIEIKKEAQQEPKKRAAKKTPSAPKLKAKPKVKPKNK